MWLGFYRRWRDYFRVAAAILVVGISLSGPTCGLWPVVGPLLEDRPVGTPSFCSVSDWADITQVWINLGVIWIAVFDRDWIWVVVRSIIRLVADATARSGNVQLSSVLLAAVASISEKLARHRTGARQPAATQSRPPPPPQAGQVPASAQSKPNTQAPFITAPSVPPSVGVVANLLVVSVCIGAVFFAALGMHRPTKEIGGDKPLPPVTYRVLLPSDVESLWEAWVRCDRVGSWRDAARLNPDVRVEGERAIIRDTGQELDIPANWNCPTAWRIE